MTNPPGSFIIPRSEKEIERQRKLAQVMMEQGMQTTPIQHWAQGAARLANALGGAIGNYQAGQMEQQRSNALAQALRSGSVDQLIATGDPTLVDVAQARQRQQQYQQQIERQARQDAYQRAQDLQQQQNFERQQTRLEQPDFTPGTPDQQELYGPDFLGMGPNGPIFHAQPKEVTPITPDQSTQYPGAVATDETGRPIYPPRAATPTPDKVSPGEAERQKQEAKSAQKAKDRVAAAQAFLSKVERVQKSIGQYKPNPADPEHPIFEGRDDLFGQFQMNPYYRGMANAVTGILPSSEGDRTKLDANMGNLAMDVATMNYTGQGSVANYERQMALGTLGRESPDAKTAYDTLEERKRDALAIIQRGGAVPDSTGGGGGLTPEQQRRLEELRRKRDAAQ